jgi:superfamily II DNA/RNA helicase
LLRHKFNAAALHGDMDQSARTAALESFRNGDVTLLVASDVAARGLDIPAVSHIFNFDVPHHPDDYVHRIGRTGRAGLTGTAITLVAPIDSKSVGAIEKLIGQPIPWAGKPAQPEARDVEHADRGDRGGHRRSGRHHQGERERHRRPHAQHGEAKRPPQQPQAPRAHPAPRKPQIESAAEGDSSHLPAFLLRPVPAKA